MVMAAGSHAHQHKRHGKHQKHTRPFMKVYWPYMPLTIIVTLGLIFSAAWQPHSKKGVLAYATSMSVSGLLQSTNQKREQNSRSDLKLNSKLDQAAQAKANDMVARNYWSHNTPDGNPPWVFITNAGYTYKSAGENLAYGYLTSSDTVNGWMASAEHKANMLSTSFSEVGFGFANSSNYQGDGPETVVVAMYASPLYSTSTVSAATTSSPPTATHAVSTAHVTTSKPAVTTHAKPAAKTDLPASATLPSETQALAELPTQNISRLSALTGLAMPWLASLTSVITVACFAALVMRHSLAIHKWITKGERYVLGHVVFDVTIVSLVGLMLIVSTSAGRIL